MVNHWFGGCAIALTNQQKDLLLGREN